MAALPNLVNYQEPLLVLPSEAQNFEYTAVPVNGSTFGPSSQILVDLGNRGFLDPASVYFRYKMTYTGANATVGTLVGTPVYTPFLRLDTFVNSSNIETINNYNTVANLYTNVNMNIADKLGQQYNFGFTDSALSNQNVDGGSFTFSGTSQAYFYSAPLIGLLSSCEKLVPLFLMNNVRLAFTLDTLSNIQSNIALESTQITNYSISNFEICYNCVDMGAAVEHEIIRMNPKLRIKSSSFATSMAPTIPTATSGSQSLVFNLRYASVKSVFTNLGGTSGGISASKNMESFDITSNNGDYQYQIGGVNYPQKSLSTVNNKAGLMIELRKAVGSILANNSSLSINNAEFNATGAAPTTVFIPAKFWVAQNLQKLTVSQKAFFTGVSTQLAPIQLNVNIGTATQQAYNALLIANYDAILELDTTTKQLTMIQ
jgi:hypothetical protein